MSETLQESDLRQYGEHDEIITPQTIYSAYLKTINGISFTSREIDIIACMVRARRPNNIASLLSIAVKNVENRIAGIKIKTDCRSQEGIIDFIEKSDKFNHINSYYCSLLNLIEFEKALKKLSVSVHESISCSLIYDSRSKAAFTFMRQVKQHLQLANIHVLKSGETYDDLTTLINTSTVKQHHIICCLSTALVERKPEILNIAKLNQEGLNPIIFISIDELPITIFNALPEMQSYINLTANKNYYCLIIDMLEKFYPFKLDKYFEHFYAGCKSTASSNELTESVVDTSVPKTKSPKWWLITCTLIGFTCTIFGTLVYKDNKKTNIENHNTPNTISKIQATQICKLPLPCAYFTGRESFLKQIKQTLKEKKKVVVVGYQGIGKTQLSYQYAKINAKKYHGGTYLLKADTPQILINSIRSFAIAMGVVTENQINHLNDEQVKQLAIPLLQNHLKNKEKMLLVLDNVSRYEDIKDLISAQFQKHEILITSIRKQWDAWDVLELKVFNQNTQEAEKLILTILKHESLESAKNWHKN